MTDHSLNKLISLRRNIHSEPELAGNEKNTARKIINFISVFSPDEIIENFGGEGIAFIFKGKEEGPAVLIRCELDALPIGEINEFDYKSKFEGRGDRFYGEASH